MFRKRVLCLLCKRISVDQEQHSRDGIGFKEPFDVRRRHPGLTRPRGHFDQHLPSTAVKLSREDLDAICLVIPLHNPPINRHRSRVFANYAGREPPFQVPRRKERLDEAGMRLHLPVPEPDFLAVREKDKRHIQLLGIGPRLPRRIRRIDRRPLGLHHRQGPAIPIAQHVIRFRPIRQRVLEPDCVGVQDLPALIFELGVNLDAGEGLIGHRDLAYFPGRLGFAGFFGPPPFFFAKINRPLL